MIEQQKDFNPLEQLFGELVLKRSGEPLLQQCASETIRALLNGDSYITITPEAAELFKRYPDLVEGSQALLTLDGEKLYLYREYQNEKFAAAAISRLLKKPLHIPEINAESWKKHFTFPAPGEIDLQMLAVLNAMSRDFAIITGGPGTGKTTVIKALTALELERDPELQIRFAAPTGKAAELLTAGLQEKMPGCGFQAVTLQRLFEQIPEVNTFRVNKESPLECGLLIIDECSMLPLELVANMFRGLSENTRIIMLGDHCQLSAIGTGAVLSELCSSCSSPDGVADEIKDAYNILVSGAEPARAKNELDSCCVELLKNYRAKNAPEIQKVAALMRENKLSCSELSFMISNENQPDFLFIPTSTGDLTALLDRAKEAYSPLPFLASSDTPENIEKIFDMLNAFRIVTATRVGRAGCENINREICSMLGLNGLYAPGTLLMITENSAATGLSNGDVGVVFNRDNGSRLVCFQNGLRLPPHELPPHECAFAMTVHKAQGSGFKNVWFLMPESGNAVLSNELFYTALTRASLHITISGSTDAVEYAIRNKNIRCSSLAERIKKNLS